MADTLKKASYTERGGSSLEVPRDRLEDGEIIHGTSRRILEKRKRKEEKQAQSTEKKAHSQSQHD